MASSASTPSPCFCSIYSCNEIHVHAMWANLYVLVLTVPVSFHFALTKTYLTSLIFLLSTGIIHITPQFPTMNFRQRMGWLMVVVFLLLSALILYYMFEISETYNGLVLEHVQSYANSLKTNPGGITWRQTFTSKLVALPFWLWLVIFLVPYLQVFCLLIACTKNDPMTASTAMAPICLVLRLCACTGKETTTSRQYGLDVPLHTWWPQRMAGICFKKKIIINVSIFCKSAVKIFWNEQCTIDKISRSR